MRTLIALAIVSTTAVPETDGVHAQVRWLQHTLDDADAAAMRDQFPEGELFTWEFYGLALINIAEQSGRADDRERAIAEARKALSKTDPLLDHRPFVSMKAWKLRGGIVWFGGQHLLRMRLVELLGDAATPDELARLHRDNAVLDAAFAASKTGVLEAHPGMSWPVDSLFALDAMQRHDARFGTASFAPAWKKHRATLLRIAAKSGLPASFIHLDGRVRDVPRGCALSWSLSVLPRLDPALSAELWKSYKAGFFSCDGVPCVVREYPKGVERKADADSGPIVGGYGMAATGFALAAARANGDTEVAQRLERTGELLGAPASGPHGKHYMGGAVPMFDVLSLYVRTVPSGATLPHAP